MPRTSKCTDDYTACPVDRPGGLTLTTVRLDQDGSALQFGHRNLPGLGWTAVALLSPRWPRNRKRGPVEGSAVRRPSRLESASHPYWRSRRTPSTHSPTSASDWPSSTSSLVSLNRVRRSERRKQRTESPLRVGPTRAGPVVHRCRRRSLVDDPCQRGGRAEAGSPQSQEADLQKVSRFKSLGCPACRRALCSCAGKTRR